MTSWINFDSASLIKDSMGLMAEYLYSLCPTAQLGGIFWIQILLLNDLIVNTSSIVPKLEGSGKLSLLSRLNSFVNGSSGESMSSAYWGIISDSILIKLRNATSTSSSSSSLPPGNDEESRMVHIMKLFCELNVRARTSFGGTVNPVRFPPSAFFLSECLQSAFVYIRNVNNLAGKLSTVENLGSNIDSNSPDREVQVRASSSKRSAADTTIAIPPTDGEQINKQKKLTVNTTTAAPVPFQNPSSGTHSPISISEINLPRIEQIIRSFCQSKHIRANKSGEVLTKAPLQQQEQQDIFNILQQPFRRQESSQQQHILRNPTAFLQSILPAEKSLPDSSNKPSDPSPPPPLPPLPQKSRRKEFTRRHKKHPNRYVLTVQVCIDRYRVLWLRSSESVPTPPPHPHFLIASIEPALSTSITRADRVRWWGCGDRSQALLRAHSSGAQGVWLAFAAASARFRRGRGRQEGELCVPFHLADHRLERTRGPAQQPLSGAAQHILIQQEKTISEHSKLIRGQVYLTCMDCFFSQS